MARNNTDRSTPWLKRVLIPFWVIQLALMIFIFAIFVWVVADNVRDFAVFEVLLLILCAASIILDAVEILLFIRRKLNPLLYLLFQCVKTTIWFALFITALARGIGEQSGETDGHVDTDLTYGVIIFGILFFAFLGTLIYAGVIFHRHRRNKRKSPAATNITQNPYYHGPYSENGMPTGHTYQPINSPYPYSVPGGETTAYGIGSAGSPQTEIHPPPTMELGGPGGDRNSMYKDKTTELEGDRRSMIKDKTTELPGESEVFELSTSKSTKKQKQ